MEKLIFTEKPHAEKAIIQYYEKQVNQFNKTVIGKPSKWLIEAAAAIGLDISDLTHEVTSGFIAHVFKQHGNEKSERARGQIAVTQADIAKIPGITAIYYEEVLTGKKSKSLRSKTMFIKMGSMSNEAFINIARNHAHVDMSGIKIVVGAGGHPDGGTQ